MLSSSTAASRSSPPRHPPPSALKSRTTSTACLPRPSRPMRGLPPPRRPVIDGNPARGKTPVITGGSGLYLKFLSHGPSPLPPGDPALRAELDAQPLDALVARLRELDPAEAARTALQNRRFVSRALEVCLLAGSALLRPPRRLGNRRPPPSPPSSAGSSSSAPARNSTTASPSAPGSCSTAARSRKSPRSATSPPPRESHRLPRDPPLLAGEIDRPTCEELINAATRQYAKRQETWFRREKLAGAGACLKAVGASAPFQVSLP